MCKSDSSLAGEMTLNWVVVFDESAAALGDKPLSVISCFLGSYAVTCFLTVRRFPYELPCFVSLKRFHAIS